MPMKKIVNRELRFKLLLLNMESSSQSNDQAIAREYGERWLFSSKRILYKIKSLFSMFCFKFV